MDKQQIDQKNDVHKINQNLFWRYCISQAYAYIFVAIFFIARYPFNTTLVILGWVFCAISVILLLAPVFNRLKTLTDRLDVWFGGGLFVAAAAVLIIDGLIGTLHTEVGELLFWTLLCWLFLLIILSATVISRRIGIMKFLVFGLGGFGLIMIFAGYEEPIYYIFAIVGLVLSMPILDRIFYSKL